MPKKLSILGSTGSIGTQSLNVCRKMGYKISALTANRNCELLEKQAREFSPELVAITEHEAFLKCRAALSDTSIRVVEGAQGVLEAATLPDKNIIILNALIGVTGLLPTVRALETGHNVALANKETLVAGGKLVMNLVAEKGAQLTPIDSEHSAIFQCLQGNKTEQIQKLIITASGGPFFGYSAEKLKSVTKAQALSHPNWNMGAKITIDSSTLMNKGLEFIEAMWLFNMPPEKIQILVHRQSIIHSMVEYKDGSVMAQLGAADMAIPIQYALTWPDRFDSPSKRLNLLECGALTFEKPDMKAFPCLADCITAAKLGGTYPSIINSANEEAVKLFLEDKISYTQIFKSVNKALEHFDGGDYGSVEELFELDEKVREFVRRL